MRRFAEPEEETGQQGDLHLVRLAQRDRLAFAPLYTRYRGMVYHYCLRRLSEPEAAADATSTIFLKAVAELPHFKPDPTRPGSTFRAWLFSIAHNAVVDIYRRGRGHLPLEGSAEVIALRQRDRLPEEMALARDAAVRLRDLLSNLPDRQRAVMELRLAELTGGEIAAALGITESAVNALQFRAYTTLRSHLRRDDPESFR